MARRGENIRGTEIRKPFQHDPEVRDQSLQDSAEGRPQQERMIVRRTRLEARLRLGVRGATGSSQRRSRIAPPARTPHCDRATIGQPRRAFVRAGAVTPRQRRRLARAEGPRRTGLRAVLLDLAAGLNERACCAVPTAIEAPCHGRRKMTRAPGVGLRALPPPLSGRHRRAKADGPRPAAAPPCSY
jgi:hypothetical protein